MSTRPLLVVAHEATRTGSVAVLLEVLRRVRGRLGRPVAVRLLASGPHADELRGLADIDEMGADPAVVLLNSALAAPEATTVPAGVPVAVWVHEQGEALRVLPDEALDALRDRCDRVWAVSAEARDDLESLGVPRDRIVVLPPIVRELRAPGPDELAQARRDIGLGHGDRLVVGCGEAGWRKGADLYLDVVRRLSTSPALRFAWIGRRPRAFSRVLDHDTLALGLEDRMDWLGEVDDPQPFLSLASVLVVASREDPQPLVPLEASQVDTPSAGFDLGGLSELAEVGGALTVPYPDTVALGTAVGRLLGDPHVAESCVERTRERIAERHTADLVTTRVVGELADLIGQVDP